MLAAFFSSASLFIILLIKHNILLDLFDLPNFLCLSFAILKLDSVNWLYLANGETFGLICVMKGLGLSPTVDTSAVVDNTCIGQLLHFADHITWFTVRLTVYRSLKHHTTWRSSQLLRGVHHAIIDIVTSLEGT